MFDEDEPGADFSGRPREHRHRRASEFSANRSAEYVDYDHCIIQARSFHIEERNRTIQ
jgi:hypothetical protein